MLLPGGRALTPFALAPLRLRAARSPAGSRHGSPSRARAAHHRRAWSAARARRHGIDLIPAGAQVLLCADPGLQATGMIDEVAGLLRAGGFGLSIFTDIRSDPTVAQADAAAALARRTGAKLLVALGGGSALDLGKAVAAVAGGEASAGTYALCAAPLPRVASRPSACQRHPAPGPRPPGPPFCPAPTTRNSGSGARRSRPTKRCSIPS